MSSEVGDGARCVNTLRPGDPFGELALLGERPRSATIRADLDSEVLRLERGRFLSLVREEPSVALAIAAALGDRLRARYAGAAGGDAGEGEAPSKPAAGPALPRRPTVSRRGIGGALALAFLALGWMLPPPEGLRIEGWHALAAVIAFIPLLATDALPEGITSLLLACVWVLAGAASPSLALSGFSSPSWVLLVSVLVIGAAIASSGLPYRLALWTAAHSRGGFAGQVAALCIAGTFLSPAVPNATARVTLVAPAITELVEALGYAPRSRPAAGLAMAVLTGCGLMVAAFLTSSTTAVLVFAVLPRTGAVELNFLSWAAYAAPASILVLLGMIVSLVWIYRSRTAAEAANAPDRDTVRLQRRLIGTPTRNERWSFAIGALLIAGFVTQPLHGVDAPWVAAFALAALTLLSFAASFVLRWQAAAPLITVVVSPIAVAAGIHPFVVGLVALMASNAFFLPYQSTAYLALYHGSGGRLFTHAQARPAAFAYAVLVLLALCASVWPWRMMGLL